MIKTQYEIILYVADQARSTTFYKIILQQSPVLEVPGMTSFELSENVKLGLMPEAGIAKILQDKTPHPEMGNGIPRCELYMHVKDVNERMTMALQSGATEVSKVSIRDWGDTAGYVSDFDGHIIAFAEKTIK